MKEKINEASQKVSEEAKKRGEQLKNGLLKPAIEDFKAGGVKAIKTSRKMQIIAGVVALIFVVPVVIGAVHKTPLEMVKGSVLSDIDSSITVGKVFDSYDHVKKKSWETKKDNAGRVFVEFRGIVDYQDYMDQLGKEQIADIPASIHFIAQFKIKNDKSGIIQGFSGLQVVGKDLKGNVIENEYSNPLPDLVSECVYRNAAIPINAWYYGSGLSKYTEYYLRW